MIELFQESIRPVNLPYTILFGISVFYWLLYLAGVFGSEVLDFDIDGDVDGGDGGAEGTHGGSVFGSLMQFVYASEVPVTVVASTLSISMWTLSVLTNYYTNNTNVLLAAALSVPIFIGGLLLTKLILMPFVPLLKRAFDESGDVIHVIGQLGVVTSLEVTDRHGQVEVPQKGSPLLLNVKSREGVSLKKGDEAVVFGRDDDGTYIVAPFEGSSNKGAGPAV